MKPTMTRLATVIVGVAAASNDHPIGKVITMLKGLQEKASSEGKTEAIAYQKFETWCKTSTSELDESIADEKSTIEELTNTIEGATKEKAGLEKQISQVTKEIEHLEIAAKKAKDIRDKDAKLYTEADADFAATIKAVEDCIKALESADDTTDSDFLQTKVASVVALTAAVTTPEQQKRLEALLQTDPMAVKAAGDAAAHVDKYSFKSGSVIELLKTLKEKFEDERLAATKAETNALNAYNLAKQARDDASKAAGESKTEKAKIKGEVEGDLAAASSERKNTEEDLSADSKTLEETHKECTVKQAEWEERSKVRSGEIEAIEAAINILAKVGGVRTEAPGNPIPPTSPVTFLQINDPKMKVVTFLREQARVTNAKALQRLAQEISVHLSGPFDEVNGMVEQMIFRLMAEQKDEDDHKNWCDLELEKTGTMIDNKDSKIEDLQKKIDVENSEIAKLTEEISVADDLLLKIDLFVKEATSIREIGKNENALAIKDAQDAQTAVANAVAVLTDFYKDSGEIAKEPYEFVQQQAPVELGNKPSTWESSYTGVSDPDSQPKGIIAVLEGCAEDFAKMEADSKAQESTDEKTYQETMQANEIEKARRRQEAEMKGNEKKRRIAEVSDLTKEKKQVSDELEATNQYMTDLKPACVTGDSSYEDRKKARAKEIEALQMAQVILRDAFKEKSSSFLQVRRHQP